MERTWDRKWSLYCDEIFERAKCTKKPVKGSERKAFAEKVAKEKVEEKEIQILMLIFCRPLVFLLETGSLPNEKSSSMPDPSCRVPMGSIL